MGGTICLDEDPSPRHSLLQHVGPKDQHREHESWYFCSLYDDHSLLPGLGGPDGAIDDPSRRLTTVYVSTLLLMRRYEVAT